MRRQNSTSLIVAVLAVTLAGCSSVRDAMEGHENLVATAAGVPLSIDDAAELTAAGIPRSVVPSAKIVDQVVDLWISYVLLAVELASPDELADLDMRPIVEADLANSVLRRFHDEVIVARVDSSDAALRTAYELERPFLRVEAYQIFISSSGAVGAELDSLRQLAEALRERVSAGEDFSRLARQYSQDPTSSSRGGYLGWVDRGHLLAELEAALLAMQPGEVSETVRTPFGYHIFKVTDRESPDFESVRDAYRRVYVVRSIDSLTAAFMDSLVEAADLRLAQGAVDLVNELAQSVRFRRASAVRRAAVLARYRGGVFTVGDWAESFNREPASEQRLIAGSDSAVINDLLIEMVQHRLVIEAAAAYGYTISEDEYSSRLDATYRNLRTLARQAGIDRHELAGGGESIASAAERAVNNARENGAQAAALRRLSMPLLLKGTFQAYEDRYPAVIERILASRQEQSQ